MPPRTYDKPITWHSTGVLVRGRHCIIMVTVWNGTIYIGIARDRSFPLEEVEDIDSVEKNEVEVFKHSTHVGSFFLSIFEN